MKKKPNWKIGLGASVLILVLMSLGKLALYELSGAAPKLRKAIGSELRLPDSVLGARGLLDKEPVNDVRYRGNDRVGIFDLSLKYDHGETGLSPFEAMKVEVVETSKANDSSRQDGSGQTPVGLILVRRCRHQWPRPRRPSSPIPG